MASVTSNLFNDVLQGIREIDLEHKRQKGIAMTWLRQKMGTPRYGAHWVRNTDKIVKLRGDAMATPDGPNAIVRIEICVPLDKAGAWIDRLLEMLERM